VYEIEISGDLPQIKAVEYELALRKYVEDQSKIAARKFAEAALKKMPALSAHLLIWLAVKQD